MQIAVVGAGIGGLAAAILLKQQSHDVTIFEAFPSPQPLGAGLLLQPPGQTVLKRLGIGEGALKNAAPIARLHSTTKTGRKLLDLRYQDLGGKPRLGLGVARAYLHAALLSKATSEHVLLELGVRVEAIGNNHINTNAGTAGPFELIIVSTGTGSDWLDPAHYGRRAPEYPWGCMWATVPLPESLTPDTLHQRCDGARKMIGLLPIQKTSHGYSAALYWSIRNANVNEWHKASFSSFLNEIEDVWPEAAEAASHITHEDFVHAKYRDIWCKRPANSNTILIGDAAHGTSPQLGQGASMALLDAYELAQQLRADRPLVLSLNRFVKARRAQLRYVRHASRFITPLFQSRSRILAFIRDVFCGPATSLPGGYDLALKTLASDIFTPEIMREEPD